MIITNEQMNIGWQEFLGFYTGLNVKRKEYDEKFVEQKGIGEEIEDPNAQADGEEEEKKEQPPSNPRFSVAYRNMAPPQVSIEQPQP